MSKKQKILACIIAFLVMLAGIALTIYPYFSVRYSETVKAEVHLEYESQVETAPSTLLDDARAAAMAYNHNLFSGVYSWLEAEKNGYYDLLDLTGTGIMGYVHIPSINVDLPIYHGTGPDELARGAGHMSQSSLPVGGENTHCAISAHSGTAKDPMFSELGRVEIGDTFELEVLGEILTYEVDSIEEVLPVEIENIKIVPGEDLCTLITCTPIGVNTHRLLVRGHRIETPEEPIVEESTEPTISPEEERSIWEEYYFNSVFFGLALALVLLIIFFVVLIILRRRKHKTKTEGNVSAFDYDARLSPIQETDTEGDKNA